MHNISDVRQIEVHTGEPLVPGQSRLEVETAIAKQKKYKSPVSDQIPEKLTYAGGEALLFDCNNYRGISLLHTKFHRISFSQV
jgi:hypothetical protein